MIRFAVFVAGFAAAGALAACGPAEDGAYSPGITAADLSTVVDNPYWPLPVGARWVYEATTPDGVERTEVEVLAETHRVWGVDARVVRDTVYRNGEMIEDTRDWYAQDRRGNVWYLGEDTAEYENGEIVSHAGAWEAGVGGALPGIVMWANEFPEGPYRQEYLPGVAEDMGEIAEAGPSVTVAAGFWRGCLRIKEFSPLEPGVEALKSYCGGVGLTLVEEDGVHEELIEFSMP